jgi:hypothetical protein
LKVQGEILFRSYSGWCKDNCFTPKNAKNAAEDWERLGFKEKRVKGRSYWHGLRVTPIVLAGDMRAQEEAEMRLGKNEKSSATAAHPCTPMGGGAS